MAVANTLAFSYTATIPFVKSVIVQAPGLKIKLEVGRRRRKRKREKRSCVYSINLFIIFYKK
jgi:hypothetical protein